MNTRNILYRANFPQSPSLYYDIQPRRDSYQMAIHTSRQGQFPYFLPSSSSSSPASSLSSSYISSLNRQLNTTQSLYSIHNDCSYCINEYLQQSTSQPLVRSLDSDILLENATYLLDSPVHALRPAHHRSRGTLSPTRSSSAMNESLDTSTSTNLSNGSIYRTVLLRSFASMFALAGLFTIETLQTSLYSTEQSFQSLLTLHLTSAITSFIFSAHASHIQTSRHRWKISNVLAYDRCSQILIIFSTIFTSVWISMQYFHWFYYLVLATASISGISMSCTLIKTFDHLLQLSTTLPVEDLKILTHRFNVFMFVYNSICQLALSIGGGCLWMIVWYQQWKSNSIFIGFQSCLLMPCVTFINSQSEPKVLLPSIPINFTMHWTETKQIWMADPTRYLCFLGLISLTTVSLFLQASTEWSTSILSMSRRLSILYYTLNDLSRVVYYRHYLFALFIGFQEGYLFGSVLKFDVTCLYGIQHAIEMLIIFGLNATLASGLFALIVRNLTIRTSVVFTSLLHAGTLVLLHLIRTQNLPYNLDPFISRYILFGAYGTVLGLWSTIAMHSICNSTKLSSSSIFAQSLALRYLGRIGAYTSALFLCQSLLFYLNSACLFILISLVFICYHCCHQ